MKKVMILAMLIFLVGCTTQAPVQETADEVVNEVPALDADDDVREIVVEETFEAEEFEIEEQEVSDVKEFRLEARQFEFIPSVIEVNEGDKVRLIVTSTDVNHGISIAEFGVRLDAPAGEEVSTEFVADEVGEYTIHCSVYCGSGHGGMQGKLIVN